MPLPTSAELADFLAPRARLVLRARKPVVATLTSGPILRIIIQIVLQLIPLLIVAAVTPLGGAAATGPGGLPWSDDPLDIPDDVRRAAGMGG